MRQGHIFLFFSISSLIFIASCKPDYIYNKSIAINKGIWTYSDTLNYEFSIEDTIGYFELFLSINHSPEFKNQNLYSRIYTAFPDGTEAIDTISLELTDKFGSWLGNCSNSSCNLDLLLKSKTQFRNVGNYKIRLEQYNRIDSLKGINSIGFMIAETKD